MPPLILFFLMYLAKPSVALRTVYKLMRFVPTPINPLMPPVPNPKSV